MARKKVVEPPKPAPKARKKAKVVEPPPAPPKKARKAKVEAAPPQPAPKVRKPKAKPVVEDLSDILDVTPTPLYPNAFLGKLGGKYQTRAALAYHRDDDWVRVVMFSDNGGNRKLDKFRPAVFDAEFIRATYPHHVGPVMTLEQAMKSFLKEGGVYDDAAYKVLTRIAKGQDPMADDTLDDILDTTPSKLPPRRVKQRTISKDARRAKRQAKFAGMSPAELRAFRDKRNARRKLRRMNAKRTGK